MSTNNLNKLEKSRGILAFAINTPTTDYRKIAYRTLSIASRVLNLPYTLITDTEINNSNTRFDVDTGTFVEWRNFNRCTVYDISPYDETLVIDVDYLILNDSLLKIFDHSWDYLLQRKSYSVTDDWPKTMGPNSLPYVWATVFAFRKTDRAKLFFNLVQRIQNNYSYYRLLFNIQERNFRNDYAFAIADIVLNGYIISPVGMPEDLLAFNRPITEMKLQQNKIVVRDENNTFVVPRTNLHIMSKAYLLSDNFGKLINELA